MMKIQQIVESSSLYRNTLPMEIIMDDRNNFDTLDILAGAVDVGSSLVND